MYGSGSEYVNVLRDMNQPADSMIQSQITELLDVETPLFFNTRIPLQGLIQPGPTYSLCGRLQQLRNSVYKVREGEEGGRGGGGEEGGREGGGEGGEGEEGGRGEGGGRARGESEEGVVVAERDAQNRHVTARRGAGRLTGGTAHYRTSLPNA